MIAVPTILSVIRKTTTLVRVLPTFPFRVVKNAARRKWNSPLVDPMIRVVYYESIKRELKIRCIYERRCNERLQSKTKEFTRLTYTGLVVELEHLKIETRLINEKFVNVMGEYVT